MDTVKVKIRCGGDPYAKYKRTDAFPRVPFTMLIAGSRYSGKSKLCDSLFLANGGHGLSKEINVQYNKMQTFNYFKGVDPDGRPTKEKKYNDFWPMTKPSVSVEDKKNHTLVIMDDVEFELKDVRDFIGQTFRQGRHEGISPVLIAHSIEDLKKPGMKTMLDCTDIYVLSRSFAENSQLNKEYLKGMLGSTKLAKTVLDMPQSNPEADFIWICKRPKDEPKILYIQTIAS